MDANRQKWLPDSYCDGREATIINVAVQENSNMVLLYLQVSGDNEIYNLSIFGRNRNYLRYIYGNDIDKWVSKVIHVKITHLFMGKKIREVF